MITKGGARGRPAELAAHLLRTDHNESVNVLDIWGCANTDLAEALKELHDIGAGARTGRTLYHANIDPRKDEQFNELQKGIAVDRLARKLGFENQPRVVVEHVKKGRHHLHVVFSRIDLGTMTAISDSHNYRKHEEFSRELEIEFGHQRTLGAHVRDKQREKRPDRAPTFADYQAAARSALTPQEAKAIVTECWRHTTTGHDFQHLLEAEGFTMARGDRRDFILVDRAGEIHGLTRRVDQVKAAEIRQRMSDVDADRLPDVAEARRLIRQRQLAQEKEAAAEFTSAIDRLRAEELKRAAEAREGKRAGLSNTDQELANAVWQLDKTMRGQREEVIVGGRPTRPEREKFLDEMAARPELEAELVHYQSHKGREATGGGQREAGAVNADMAATRVAGGGPEATRRPSVEVENPIDVLKTIKTPEKPAKRSMREKLRDLVADLTGKPHPNPAPAPAPQVKAKAIEEAQGAVSPPKRAAAPSQENQRPSAYLFICIFGAVIDAYRHAFDRAIVAEQKRQQAGGEGREPSLLPTKLSAPLPAPAPAKRHESLAEEMSRKNNDRPDTQKAAARAAAEAAQRLRDEEERQRIRSLGSDDPRY